MNISKRLFDIFFSIIIIILTFIPLIFFLVLIKIESKGPSIYWSKRIGKNNSLFLMPKLRSMYVSAPEIATHNFSQKKYITIVGNILRKTSIDELPQFYIVLFGKMSVVGPRPALYNQFDLINLRSKANIDKLFPGITGLAQISGRDNLSIKKKIKYEKIYMNKMSLFYDLVIVIKTVTQLFKIKNISH